MTKPNPKLSLIVLFLALNILVFSPQTVFAWVSVSLGKTILPADGRSTTRVDVNAWDENGQPSSIAIKFSLNPQVGSVSPASITTGSDGRGSTTYKAGTIPGYVFITATSAKASASARITLVGVEIEGPKFVAIDQEAAFEAKITPSSVSGTFAWTITQGKNRVQIIGSSSENTLKVKGVKPSQNIDDVTLNLTFIPAGADPKDWKPVKYKFSVEKVEIGNIVRVPPTKTKTVTVTVTPSLTGSGQNMALDIIRTTGTGGSATVNPTSITAATTVTITGGEQTNVGNPDNLSLRAKLGETVFASKAFSVCAHPIDFHQTVGMDAGNGILHFEYAWASDSGNIADLNEVLIGEYVTYPGGNPYNPPNPPFDNWFISNPTVLNVSAADGAFQDNHSPSGGFSTPYKNSSYTATQIYRFHCNRDMTSEQWELIEGPIFITRTVTHTGGRWKYIIRKSGISAPLNLP